MRKHLFFIAIIVSGFVACKKSDGETTPEPVPTEKSMTEVSFKVADNPAISHDVTATLSHDTFNVLLPAGTSRLNLVPNIKYKGASLSPAMQTPRNFGTVVSYTVKAKDGSVKDYFVNVRTETSNLILGYWNIFHDSSVSAGNFFIMSAGGGTFYFPSQNYYGIPGDHYDFRTNATFTFHGDNRTANGVYSITPQDKLLLDGTVLGPANIVTLTATDLIFTWSLSSNNGGTYYRKILLKR